MSDDQEARPAPAGREVETVGMCMQRIAEIVGTTTHGQRMDIIDVIAAYRAQALEEAAQKLIEIAERNTWANPAMAHYLRSVTYDIRALARADGQQPVEEHQP